MAPWKAPILDLLTELIQGEWQPAEMPKELQYRDNLLAFLRQNVPEDVRVEREYRHTGTTADIYLKWPGLVMGAEVFFEIKRSLIQKPSLDRLVGQIEQLEPRKRKIILVIVGTVDKGLLGRLRERYASELDPHMGNFRIVEISANPL